jgi:hypothetical protein
MTPAGLMAARRSERLVRDGGARYRRHDLAGAEPLLREALIEAERSGRARVIARASQPLYFVLRRQGRHVEALTVLERKVAAQRRLCGVDGRWTAEWRNELIGLYGHLGRSGGELEAVCRERLASDVRQHGEQSPEAAWSLLTLAWALRAAGRWDESEALCRRALDLIESIHGCDHPRSGWALIGLALAALPRGDAATAEASLCRARGNWARVGHIDRAAAVDELLVALYLGQGRSLEALDVVSRPAPGRAAIAAERRLRCLEVRAAILHALEREHEAASCEDEARELRCQVEGRQRELDRLGEEALDAPVATCGGTAPIAGPLFPSPLL